MIPHLTKSWGRPGHRHPNRRTACQRCRTFLALELLEDRCVPSLLALEQPLLAPASPERVDDWAGSRVAIDGDYAVVGAPHYGAAGAETGAALVFQRNDHGTASPADDSWDFQQVLLPNDLGALDSFGSALAISGDTIVVGAPAQDGSSADRGAAYVFVRQGTTWSQQAKLLSSNPSDTSFFFGQDVAISGNLIAVGMAGVQNFLNYPVGAVDLFERPAPT